MEEILKKLNEVINICKNKISELEEKIRDSESIKSDAEEQKTFYQNKLSDLDERENKIKESEFVDKTLFDAHNALQEVENAKINLNKIQEDVEKGRALLEVDKKDFKEYVEHRESDFVKQDEELNAKRASYKKEVLDAIEKEKKVKPKTYASTQ